MPVDIALQPEHPVLWVSESTLMSLARAAMRYSCRLLAHPFDPVSSSSWHDFTRLAVRILRRDPFALAATLSTFSGPPKFNTNSSAQVWELIEKSFASNLSAALETLSNLLLPNRQGHGHPATSLDARSPLARGIHEAFALKTLFQLRMACEAPRLIGLIPFVVGLVLLSRFAPEIDRSTWSLPPELATLCNEVETAWNRLSQRPQFDFLDFLQSLKREDGIEEWFSKLASDKMEAREVFTGKPLEAVLQAAERRWEWWWRSWPGASGLFRSATAVLSGIRAHCLRLQETLEAAKLEALADFAAGAAHEINNPLAVIAGHAQLLLRRATDPDTRHTLAMILTQVQRAHEMIADTRLYARPVPPALETVDYGEILRTVIKDLQPLAEQCGVTIALHIASNKSSVSGVADRRQLLVALEALGKNAIEAAGQKGTVEFRLDVTNTEVLITVEDTGPGIPDEHRTHIFNPFYSSRQAGRGLGMGLPKAWSIVRQHRGYIDVAPRPGGGTVFRVCLPRSCHASKKHPEPWR